MGIKNVYRNAHTAFRAMPKIRLTTNSTEATLVAMKRIFGLAHPEIAPVAMVLPKHVFAADALIPITCHE